MGKHLGLLDAAGARGEHYEVRLFSSRRKGMDKCRFDVLTRGPGRSFKHWPVMLIVMVFEKIRRELERIRRIIGKELISNDFVFHKYYLGIVPFRMYFRGTVFNLLLCVPDTTLVLVVKRAMHVCDKLN